ncbi:hypothetical protein BDY21DRAFT_391902 [Lineolata rhizophorae]|uniref:DNA repair protein REV1 n=1 Tax=Lineolata rhizophorae TaxID=578093 RepID=A0A6A6P0Z4_9PEZI|nr:hypothetical protein BDY21DRAFT_391902 [Lineolata rhizophorae]
MGSRLEANSAAVRKRIENHTFDDEHGEEYAASSFGGFGDYFRRKKIKLQNLDHELRSQSATESKPPIFRGVVAHVNGYTQPSLQDLHKLIVTHGGGFQQYLDGKTAVTHIIASSLTPKKKVDFRKYRVVKPAWVVDSVKEGKLLPWDRYRVVDEGPGQKVIGFGERGEVKSQVNKRARGYKDQTDASWYTEQLKSGRRSSGLPTPDATSPPELERAEKDEIVDDDELYADPTQEEQLLGDAIMPEADDDRSDISDGGVALPVSATLDDISPEDDLQLVIPPKLPTSPTPPTHEHAEVQNTSETMPTAEHASPKPYDHAKKSPSKHLTAERHNAILLSDPKIRRSTVVNPGFLDQYYRESRLHHLSTWKADLKSQMAALAADKFKSSQQQPQHLLLPKRRRTPGARRYILHVDFDSFFAAVSLKKHPHLKEHPCVVAHGPGSGSEIASCNYPARKFGIRNGMWMRRAQELCPEVKILPYDFPAYEEASRAFYAAILAVDGVVQSVSIDEALLDVSQLCLSAAGSDGRGVAEGGIYREQAKADEVATNLRADIKAATGCHVSVGIGGNVLLAKVALRKAKPAGQYQIRPEEVLDFVGGLTVQDLPGVAWSIGGRLEDAFGVKSVRDLRENVSKEKLVNLLGPKTGERLWEYARGIDRTEVAAGGGPDDKAGVRKSVSAEVNWGVRFETQAQADEFVGSLAGELARRLGKEKLKGRQLTMKVMKKAADAPLDPPKHLGHGKCDTFSRGVQLGVATMDKEVLSRECLALLRGFGISPGELRGIGVQMTKLEPLKGGPQDESSQKRLVFKAKEPSAQWNGVSPAKSPATAAAARVDDVDPIQDDTVVPMPPKRKDTGMYEASPAERIRFGATQLEVSSPSRKPLNTLGTQFIMPTQVDPKVLQELPDDIRSRLARQGDRPRKKEPSPAEPVTPSKKNSGVAAAEPLPTESQLDPDILAALPPDVRNEVLSFYKPKSPTPPPPQRQNQPAAQPLRKQQRAKLPVGANTTLTQSSFFTAPRKQQPVADGNDATVGQDGTATGELAAPDGGAPDVAEDIAPDFLAALPEDIRVEVLAEQRRARTASTRQPAAAAAPNQPPKPKAHYAIVLPPRPALPRFTAQRLSSLPQLRDAVDAWWEEFREEGPYREDVEALAGYLEEVVGQEKDLEKAVGVAGWLAWVVREGEAEGGWGDGEEEREEGMRAWREAVERVRGGVQTAVRRRGLPRVEF